MTPAEAADLRDRWARDQPVNPTEIAAALDQLVHALNRLDQARAVKDQILQGPWPDVKTGVAAAEKFLADTADPWGR